jgi:hypothetical protein
VSLLRFAMEVRRTRLAEVKPVVACLSNVVASGG